MDDNGSRGSTLNPIDVEQAFRRFIYQIESTESIRYRYQLLMDFLVFLNGEYRKYESYIQQIIEMIPVYLGPIIWSGVNPKEIEESLLFLESVSDKLDSLNRDSNFNDIVRRFKEVTILIYSCLNDCQNAILYIQQIFDENITKKIDFNSYLTRKETSLELLQKLLQRIATIDHPRSEEEEISLQRLLKQIQTILSQENGAVLIPVTETYNQQTSQDQYGRLRNLSIEMFGPVDGEDQLVKNFRIYGAEQPDTQYQNKEVLRAARNLLDSKHPGSSQKFYKGGIFFELTGAIHYGSSADLAISALWYTKLANITCPRDQYQLHPKLVITGVIDSEGNILPVNKDSITLKTEAAFFSWAQKLVVPHSQKHLFNNSLKLLKAQYPTRKIELVPVKHLKDLIGDPRLTSHDRLSWWKHIVRKLK